MVFKQKKDRTPLRARLRALLAGTFLDRVCAIVFVVIAGCAIWISLPPAFFRGIVVSFDVRAERYFVCSAFYREHGNGPLERVNESVYAGDSHVRLVIPATKVEWLRIDYGMSPGHVKSSPVLVSGDKDEVLEWKNFNAFNDFKMHTVLADGWLSLESEGNDPYVICGKKLDVCSGMHFDILGIMARIFLLLAVVVGVLWRTRLAVSGRAIVSKWCVQPVAAKFDAVCHRLYVGCQSLWSNRSFAIYMVVIIMLAWGFELFNFTFSIDDELVLYGDLPISGWLKEGRWGMFLLCRFYGNNSVPLFPFAITLILYSLTFVLIFDHLGKSKYFLFPVYAAFPGIYLSFSFSSLNPGVGLSFFLAAMAIRLSEGGILAWCAAVLMGAMSIGCYQIFVFFMAIVVVIRCMDKIFLADTFCWRSFVVFALRGCCMVLLAYGAYRAIAYGFQQVTGVGESYIAKLYLHPPEGIGEWRAWCPLAFKRMYTLLSGAAGVFPMEMWAFQILLVGGIGIVGVWMVLGRRPPVVRLALFTGCIFLFVLAFIPLAFNRTANVPDRVLVLLVPVVVVGVLVQAVRCFKQIRLGLVIGASICMLCAFQFIFCLNQMIYSNYIRNRHDAEFVAMVRSRVEELPEVSMRRFRGEPVPLLVVGRSECYQGGYAVIPVSKPWGWPVWNHDHIGKSLLTEPKRWGCAIKTYLGTDYDYVEPYGISKMAVRCIENMPIWPLAGSVVWQDGCVIVKFSDFDPMPAFVFPRLLSRKMCLCTEFRINGFDELTFTDVDAGSLLHRYGKGGILASASGRCELKLPPYSTTEPYLILEFRVESTKDSLLWLWGGDVRQECQFVMQGGMDVLRLRVPSDFLCKPLRMTLSSSSGAMVKILDVNVYADKNYAKRLFKLNSELKTL